MAAARSAVYLARRARRPPHQLTRTFIPDATQLLVDAQACTGLPWYATIPCATFALRSALVPASIVARRHGRRINLAAPHLRKLQQLAAERSKERPDDKIGTARLLTTGINGILKLHGARPSFLLLPFTTTLPSMVYLALGVRGLPEDMIAEGGCLWFPDLSVSDPYLPCVCVAAAYANLERQLAAPPGKASLAGVAKHAGQLALIATAPVTFALPSGFHLFWLSSTLFTALSGEAFRVLDRPPVMPPPPVAASSKEASPPRRPRRRRKGKKRRP
jgi:membrane protein insertase Oxa1/YidC/SpoIIIJ